MIIKPYVDREERDPRRSAGRRAERQMAHYMDRHFHDRRKLHVLHDVRIEHEGEVAQMDHLVVHGFGIAIVESKSVSTAVRINAAGEWARSWNGRWQGMPDAIFQGERQGMLLKMLLTSRQAELIDKAVMGLLREPRKNMALDVFAAISHKGTFRRASKGQAPRALKAEAVPNAIQDVIAGYRHAAVAVGASIPEARYAPRVFKDAEVLRIGHFLRTWHAAAGEAEEPGPTAAEDSAPRSPRASRQLSPAMPEVVAAAPPPAESAAGAIAADAGDDVVLVCKGYGGSDLEARVAYSAYGRRRAGGTNTSSGVRCAGCDEVVWVERVPGGFAGAFGEYGRSLRVRVGA